MFSSTSADLETIASDASLAFRSLRTTSSVIIFLEKNAATIESTPKATAVRKTVWYASALAVFTALKTDDKIMELIPRLFEKFGVFPEAAMLSWAKRDGSEASGRPPVIAAGSTLRGRVLLIRLT